MRTDAPVAARYQDTDVAEAYDRQRFHSPRGRYNNWRLRRLLNKVLGGLSPGSVVLDIPCGTGRIDNWLLNASLRVIAADISNGDAGGRTIKGSAYAFVAGVPGHLPFRSRSVDGVLCIRFLHLLDQQARRRCLNEVARVMRQWVVVEYRIERPVKAAKRAIIRWLTGRTGRTKMMVSGIADELSKCGLLADHYYFVSRWFSGSVLVMAHRQEPGAVIVASPSRLKLVWARP